MRPIAAIAGLAMAAAACSGSAPATTEPAPASPPPVTVPATTTTTVAPTTAAAPTTTTTGLPPDPAGDVVAAAERTLAATQGRFRITKASTVLGRRIELVTDGAFAGPARRLSLAVGGDDLDFLLGDLSDEEVAALSEGAIFEVLTDGEFFYFDFLADVADEPDAGWLRAPVDDASAAVSAEYGALPVDLSVPLHVLWPSLILQTAPLDASVRGPGEYEVGIDPHLLAGDAVSQRGYAQLVEAGLDDADLGSPIPVTVEVDGGHVVRMAGDLTELFGRIARLPIAPPGMEIAAEFTEVTFEVAFFELGVPQEIAFPDPAEVTDVTPHVTAVEVAAGTCLPNGPEDLLPSIVSDVVDCGLPHHGEVYAVFDYPEGDGSFPGESVLEAAAAAMCFAVANDYLGGPQVLAGVEATEVRPTEQTWRFGDREVICAFYAEEPLTGSLAGAMEGAAEASTYYLEPGTCLADDSWFGQELVEPVECGEPHRFEVISRHAVQGHVFPGADAVSGLADELCTPDVLAVDPAAAVEVWWLTPNEATWWFGDRGIICLAGSDEPRTGSLAP